MSEVITERQAPRPTRRWVRPALVAGLALCLLGGLTAAAWWWTNPRVLASQVLDGRSSALPGQEIFVALAEVNPAGEGEVLHFSEVAIERGMDTVDPNLVSSDRRLKAEVVVCVNDPGEETSLGQGSAADMRQYCTDVRPLLPGGSLNGRDQAESLFLRLSAEGRGLFRLDGVNLDYRRDGLLGQRGTQRLSMDLAIDTRGR